MSHLSFFLPHAPTKAHRERDTARAKISEIFTKVIDERRAAKVEGNTDFLQVILDARYKDGSEVTTEETVGLLLAALFAGQHTSNITGVTLL
jgi:sterol 14-demethylase